jgi:hypothetical protein
VFTWDITDFAIFYIVSTNLYFIDIWIGVKAERFKIFNIIKVLLDVNRMQSTAHRVPAKHPLRPSNSDPTANSTP